jgi:hypothetical protein
LKSITEKVFVHMQALKLIIFLKQLRAYGGCLGSERR